jgi:DNA-binding MarR family transcriptional regulator
MTGHGPRITGSALTAATPPPAPTLEEYQRAADLRAAIRAFLRRGEQIARRQGLTPQRHLMLLMIKGAPDGRERSTITELVERLKLAQSTVTELVARAERAGLVNREPSHSDGRVVYLRVTAAGEQRLAACVTGLGPERAALIELLGGAAPPP